ncbi:MAG: proline iminopeptidase-family hydrolase [Candidatus Cloacimonetes bacterium]|nr:proline iminopeptidase-family hydrolase [Candidatus Cloacimonadota bacterium]
MEGYIEVTGGKVWYKIVGAKKKGVPLLVVHGGPGVPHDYLETLDIFAEQRPVIFYDQLGCGNSDKPADQSLWTVDRFVEELEQVKSYLKLEKFHILGQSWGTMLTVEYLLRKKPEGVCSIILSAPYLSTNLWVADQQKWIEQLPREIAATICQHEASGEYSSPAYQEAMMTFYNKHVCRLNPWPECLNRSMQKIGFEIYSYMWGPSEFTMTGTLKNADLTSRLKEIDLPILYTCGEYDEATPETTKYYHNLTVNSEIHIFRDASHSHHLEKIDEFYTVVRNFLGKHE